MITLMQGKTLCPGDLGLVMRDSMGRITDPASVTYSIFSIDSQGQKALVSPPKGTPTKVSTGTFYIPITIPTIWEGKYNLVWYIVETVGGPENTVFEEFMVERINPATTSFEAPSVLMTSKPGLNKKIAEKVMLVRELLSDTDPDRNYHFRPPTPGKVVAGFNSRVGFIWDDSTIIRMLKLALSKINTGNPMADYNYTLETAPDAWKDAAAVGAAAHCLSKEAARWAAEEFGYSLNGVSLDVNKAATYQQLASAYQAEFDEWIPNLTANRPCSAGVRQYKFLLG